MNPEAEKPKNKGASLCKKMILELWTPAHIGSGEELKKEFDFVFKDSLPFVADIRKTLDSIMADEPRLNDYLNTASLRDLEKIAGQLSGYALPPLSEESLSSKKSPAPLEKQTGKKQAGSRSLRLPARKPYNSKNRDFAVSEESETETIREHLKDAFFRPFVPGSSLKGAIRTALWAEALIQSADCRKELRESLRNRNKNPEGLVFGPDPHKNPEGLVFGPDPQKDVMKALSVSDGYFELKSLRLGDTRWANVCNGAKGLQIKWRDLKSKKPGEKNQDGWRFAKGVYIEALAAGAKAEFVFSWDEFLLKDFSSWSPAARSSPPGGRAAGFPPKNFQDLKEILNRHALRIAKSEKAFFERYGLPEAAEFYSRLEGKIKSESKLAWLRLGWGGSWHGMTGLTEKFLRENSLKEDVYALNNARGKELYPKTRRLLIEGGSPRLPLGWALLYPSEEGASEERIQNPYRKSFAAAALDLGFKAAAGQGGGASAAAGFSSWLSKKTSDLSKKHNIKDIDEILKGRPLAQEWQSLPKGEEKLAIQKEIIDYWKQRGFWDEPQGRGQKKAKAVYQGSQEGGDSS